MNSLFGLSLTIFLVAACSATDYGMSKENVKKLMQVQSECAKTTNISEELVKRSNSLDFPSFEELGCYPLCILRKFRTFEKDFVLDRINSYILEEEHDKFWPVIRECVKERGNSPCEKAYNGYRCYAKYAFQN